MRRWAPKLFLATLLAAGGCTTTPPEESLPTAAVQANPPPPTTFDHIVDGRALAPCQPKAKRLGGSIGLPMTPSDFATMSSCRPTLPNLPDLIARTERPGQLTAQGDCALAGGITCRVVHGSNEFGAPGLASGEVQCTFEASRLEHPTIVGFLYTCRPGTAPASTAPATSSTSTDRSCGAMLPKLLANCGAERRCCAYGNLTEPWSTQSPSDRRRRPNFAVCGVPKDIDCGAAGPLAKMQLHRANDGLKAL